MSKRSNKGKKLIRDSQCVHILMVKQKGGDWTTHRVYLDPKFAHAERERLTHLWTEREYKLDIAFMSLEE